MRFFRIVETMHASFAHEHRSTMALAVVNYPTLSDDDFAWTQSVRREHDPLYVDVIDPHFTLVFPTDTVSEATLIDHV